MAGYSYINFKFAGIVGHWTLDKVSEYLRSYDDVEKIIETAEAFKITSLNLNDLN